MVPGSMGGVGGCPALFLKQTNTYFGSTPPGLSSILMPIPTEGETLLNSIPPPVEQNWAQNLKTICQWVKHSKEQTTLIGLIILWNEQL